MEISIILQNKEFFKLFIRVEIELLLFELVEYYYKLLNYQLFIFY